MRYMEMDKSMGKLRDVVDPGTICQTYPGTISRSYPGEIRFAPHVHEFHGAGYVE